MGDGILNDPVELLAYESDGLARLRETPALVVLPHDAAQVQAVVRCCHVHGVPFVEIAPLPAIPRDPVASPFTIGLIEAIVGGEPVPEAIAYAATFVDGQLRALPPKLQLLFNCGMTGFRFVTRLRFLRGYCDVPLEARRAWTRKWAESRIALLRQLFKPVRAIALLAYYDHEAVATELLGGKSLVPAIALVRERAAAAEREAELA